MATDQASKNGPRALAVVTGANRGIGLELVRQRLRRGAQVLAACRTTSRELAALQASSSALQIVPDVDVAQIGGIARLVAAVGDRPVELLLHNAGVLQRDGLAPLDVEAIRTQFEVNALGPLQLTAALKPRLQRGAKVAIVTSRMGSIADNSSGGYYGYRMSKAAVNMAGMSLAHDLRGAGVAVVLLHPGYVRTGMTGGQGNVEPADAARGLLERIDALTLATTGSFWQATGESLPW